MSGWGFMCLLLSSAAQADTPASASPPSAPSPAVATPAPHQTVGPWERGWWWDLNVEGGLGTYIEPGHPLFGMGRVRGGAMYMFEPWYFSFGALYQASTSSLAAFGVQFEALHLWSGWWGQVGGLMDLKGAPSGSVAVGYSLVGVEAEGWAEPHAPNRVAVFVKLRIPVPWLLLIGKPSRLPALESVPK